MAKTTYLLLFIILYSCGTQVVEELPKISTEGEFNGNGFSFSTGNGSTIGNHLLAWEFHFTDGNNITHNCYTDFGEQANSLSSFTQDSSSSCDHFTLSGTYLYPIITPDLSIPDPLEVNGCASVQDRDSYEILIQGSCALVNNESNLENIEAIMAKIKVVEHDIEYSKCFKSLTLTDGSTYINTLPLSYSWEIIDAATLLGATTSANPSPNCPTGGLQLGFSGTSPRTGSDKVFSIENIGVSNDFAIKLTVTDTKGRSASTQIIFGEGSLNIRSGSETTVISAGGVDFSNPLGGNTTHTIIFSMDTNINFQNGLNISSSDQFSTISSEYIEGYGESNLLTFDEFARDINSTGYIVQNEAIYSQSLNSGDLIRGTLSGTPNSHPLFPPILPGSFTFNEFVVEKN